MNGVEVINDPGTAAVALDPMRSRLLAELQNPASATTLSKRVGITRQKVNYHLKSLEEHFLVRSAGERQWGGITERLLVASASSYVISPSAMGMAATHPEKSADRLSADFLVSLAARIISEVGALIKKAREIDKTLPSLSIDTQITFKSPSDRAAFTEELTNMIGSLAQRYHDESSPIGRSHRLIVVSHPMLNKRPEAK